MGRDARINRERKGLPEHGQYILDRYGRPVTVGCEMTFMQPTVASLFVQAIEPAVQMDPRQAPIPPGMVKVTCLAHFTFLAQKAQSQREFVLARDVPELIEAGMLREVPEGAALSGAEVKVPEEDARGEEPEEPLPPPTPGPKLVALTDADPRD